MRWVDYALIGSCALMALILSVAIVKVMLIQEGSHSPLKNAYWPYSVEIAVRDR